MRIAAWSEVSISASLKPIAWCSAIGLPKASRSRAYASAAPYAARARPTEIAAVITRISERIPPIFSTPPVSPPRRCSAGTSTSSRRSSPVREARTDILSIFLPRVLPRSVERCRWKCAARELLGEEAVGPHVRAGAAVRLGVAEAQIAELADALEERPRELGARVDRRRGRHHFGVHEPGDGAAELFLLRRELDHRRI